MNTRDQAFPAAQHGNTQPDVQTIGQNADSERNASGGTASQAESQPFLAARQRAEVIYRHLASTHSGRKIPQYITVTPEALPRVSLHSAEELVISAGLVQRCSSDHQLAGVLALALADSIAKHSPAPNVSEREPLDLRIGPESNTYGELPLLRQAELVKTGYAHRSAPMAYGANPEVLAWQIYRRAGFNASEFGSARALYHQARRN